MNPNLIEVGVDEVGRGCLAGPVVACAVLIPEGVDSSSFKDSKKIAKKKRESISNYIRENCFFGIGLVDPAKIDEINILQATFVAMREAIDNLILSIGSEHQNLHLLIDGDKFPGYPGITHDCVVKGDSLHKCISAASIVAKVHRDGIMEDLSRDFPDYLWESNSGYGTKDHMQSIEKHGLTIHHRRSFCSRFL